MSEAVTPPVEGQPPVAPVVPETPVVPSNLPSDQTPPDVYDGFALNDDIKAKFKDGKLNGRFGSIDEVLAKLKEAEDFKANTVRDIKDAGATAEQNQASQQLQQTTVNELIPEFMRNGMVLTPEMEAKATAAKIDVRDLKIGAMEMREATQKAHSVVGGQENYDAMIAWGKISMSPEQQASFDKAVVGSMSEYAIKGLNSDYQMALSKGEVQHERIEGQPAFQGVTPYKNRRELYKDKDYIETPAGRRDTAAIKQYKARLSATPDNVIFGQ